MYKLAFFSSSEFTLPILKSILQSQDKTLGQIASSQYNDMIGKIVLLPHDFSPRLFNKELLQQKINLSFVVTQPDRNNRGKIFKNPISNFCYNNNIKVYQPNKINDEVENFKSQDDIDFAVVASFGQILNQKVLNVPKYGAVNWHPSLLPKYRGASPMQSAIKNGDDQTGLTWIQMGTGMDNGDIWLQIQKTLVNENFSSLASKMGELGGQTWAIILAMRLLQQHDVLESTPIVQKEEKSTYCKMISKEEAFVYPKKQSSKEIYNHFNAYIEFPGTVFSCNYFGQQIKINQIGKNYNSNDFNALLKESEVKTKNPNNSFWIQLRVLKKIITLIECADGYLEIKEATLRNGKKINFSGFNF